MSIIGDNRRLPVIVKNSPRTALHLIVGNGERGMVFFACEQAPLMTFQSYGFVKRCPICQQENPISAEKENE